MFSERSRSAISKRSKNFDNRYPYRFDIAARKIGIPRSVVPQDPLHLRHRGNLNIFTRTVREGNTVTSLSL